MNSLLIFVNFLCSINLHTIWDLPTNISLLSPVLNLLLDVDLSLSQALQFGINYLFLFVFVFLFPPSVTSLKFISFLLEVLSLPDWLHGYLDLLRLGPSSLDETFELLAWWIRLAQLFFSGGASSKCLKIWTGRETCYLHKQILRSQVQAKKLSNVFNFYFLNKI